MSQTNPPTTTVDREAYIEELNKYYSYKRKYEDKYQQEKAAIKNTETLNAQEKQKKIMRIKRNRKCVSCGQTGGTIFTNVGGVLSAKCGNKSEPCLLNIEIVKGKFMNLEELSNKSLLVVNLLKEQIIKTKLNVLFNYITEEEAVNEFKEEREALDQALEIHRDFREKYLDVVCNSTRNEEVDNLTRQFHEAVQTLKGIMQSRTESSSSVSHVVAGVSHYLDVIVNLNKQLMEKKYVYCAMEKEDSSYHLVQKKYTLEQLEFEMEVPIATAEARTAELRKKLLLKKKKNLAAYIYNWTKDQERLTGNVYEVSNLDDPEIEKEDLIDLIIENNIPIKNYNPND